MKGNVDVVNEPKYSTIEAAAKLDVHPVTLTRWRLRGLIGCYRNGRVVLFGESHLREYWESRERKAKGGSVREREAA